MSKTYTVKQVAEALDFSTNTVYKYLDEGKIQSTRLGKEGRFRIPEKEVIRLLGLKGESPQIAIRPPQSLPEENQLNEAESSPNDQLAILNKVSSPDLFDWFISLSAIFLGMAYFLFPIHYQSIALEPYRNWSLILKITLILSGLILMAIDIFVPVKKHHHHIFSRLPIALSFSAFSLIFYSTGNLWVMTYFLSLALFSLISLLWHSRPFLRFILFTYFLTVVSGIVFAKNPQPYFFADVRRFIEFNPGLFEALLVGGSTIFILLTIFGYFRSQALFFTASSAVAIVYFAVGISLIFDQDWTKTVVALLIGAFAVVFIFEQKFDSISKFTRREVLIAFSWMVLVLLVGLGFIYYVQMTFRLQILQQAQNKVVIASNVIGSFVAGGVKATQSYAQTQAMVKLLSSAKKDTGGLEAISKDLFLGTTVLYRITIVDDNGLVLAYYPPTESTYLVNLSDQDYFRLVQSSKKTVISNTEKPKEGDLPVAVYIGVPILDENDKFLGMISAEVDLNTLSGKLDTMDFGQSSFFTVVDSNKKILIHQDKALIGQEVKNGSIPGQSEGYSSEGKLSLQAFAPVKPLGWSIILEWPYSEVFYRSSQISFVIFLVSVILGVGTLMSVMYIKRSRS